MFIFPFLKYTKFSLMNHSLQMNSVYLGTSLDGFIADRNGGLDWLDMIPVPEGVDMGYNQFMSRIDALVMGRNTFETVCGFDIDWPYEKPVFVLSEQLDKIPEKCNGKVFLIKGKLKDVLAELHEKGHNRLYIDGGATVRRFLSEDLIDELIITTIPIILGGGIPLFMELPESLELELVSSEVYLDQIVQSHYKRKRD